MNEMLTRLWQSLVCLDNDALLLFISSRRTCIRLI